MRLEQSLRNVGRESLMARLKEVMSVKRQMGAVSPLNDLFLSMLDRLDADVESIGDSKQRLTEIDT